MYWQIRDSASPHSHNARFNAFIPIKGKSVGKLDITPKIGYLNFLTEFTKDKRYRETLAYMAREKYTRANRQNDLYTFALWKRFHLSKADVL